MENEIVKQITTLKQEEQNIAVKDFSTCEIAGDFLKSLKPLRAEIDNTFDPIISKAHQAHKEAVAQKKKYIEPIDALEKSIKDKIRQYQIEQEKIRKAEEERIRKELELKAKKEKEEAALKAIDENKIEEAEKIIEKPIEQPKYSEYQQLKQKTTTTVTVDNWKYEILDPQQVPREYCCPDDKMISMIVKANKGKVNIPGVRVYNEPIVRIK